MANPWTMKMEQFTRFTADQRRRLEALVCDRHETYEAHTDILSEGKRVDECHVILSGLAARYKMLPDGSRQILAFLVPGDLCDAEIFILSKMDHAVAALTETRCAIVPARTMKLLLREVSCLAEALWWGTMTDLAVLRERIVDHGRRDARSRIAHLLYEMLVRYRIVGLAEDDDYEFPVTQEELADATGLTPVHVNRMLQQMREEGLIESHSKRMTVLDAPALKKVGGFNADYLHLMRTESGDLEVSGRAGDLI
ncbi:Crp/Fnr family transcriptional regulator [Allosphingosinicella sp.]|jgi:CRP-like cAMP-binding protein|uniref:Crp/Fnr family transcriptional regulator n=1 Tax=Allosphingosinicella sp. TaxID=2823234 RepID=UPI002F190313